MTLKLDRQVKYGAQVLNDFELLAKLADGDMVVLEFKYHNNCLLAFYRRVNQVFFSPFHNVLVQNVSSYKGK